MPKKKPESTLYAVCPKCHREIQVDISALLKSITDVFKFNEKTLQKELKECLTNGWSEHEKSHWKDYLEEEVKPYWPALYDFLKKEHA